MPSRRRLVVPLAAVAIVAAAAVVLREGSEPHLPLTALARTGPPERGGGRPMVVGMDASGVHLDGWARTANYRPNLAWSRAAPELDRELRALGFRRVHPLRPNGAEWYRADMAVRAQTHWTRATGSRLSDLTLARRATSGEIVRIWSHDEMLRRGWIRPPGLP